MLSPLSSLSFGKFLVATALGMAHGAFVFVYLGEALPGPGVYSALAGLAALAASVYSHVIFSLIG